MSLTASLWTSVSGLLAHGEKMNVVGNNISNVNTVGFKSQRMDFQDFVYQGIGTAAGTGQVGRGTSIGIVMNDFSQGSLETTTASTDIAISGNGFFAVKPQNNNMTYYTRAGNFRFDKDGSLVDPHGYVLQGWAIDRASQLAGNRSSTGIIGTGAPVDIKLDNFTCPPRATQNMTVPVNLKNSKAASDDDNCTNTEDPFFSMLKTWDATQEQPIGSKNYAYQSTMEVYDEAGKLHKLTIYYDRVSNSDTSRIDEYTDSESYWEYIITMDPADDMRDFSSTYTPGMTAATTPDVPDKLKGLLGAGTLTFSSNGELKDMTAFVPHTDGSASDHWWTGEGATAKVNLDKWIAAPINSDGLPVIAPNFSGTAGLSQAYQNGVWDQPNVNATGKLVAVDLGLRSKNNSWSFTGDPNGNTPATYVDTAGNKTDLVKASGMSRTFEEQVKENGKYQWSGTVIDPVTYKPYTVSSTSSNPNLSNWGTTPVGSNASEYYWELTLSGNIIGTNPQKVQTTVDSGSFTITANPKNQSNALSHTYTTSDSSINIVRASTTASLTAPSDFKSSTWELYSDDGVNGVWVDDISKYPDFGATFTAPLSKLPVGSSATAVQNFMKSQPWDNQANPVGATEFYWQVSSSNGTVVADVTTADTSPIKPGVSSSAQGNNADEYYWASQSDPDTIATTGAIPSRIDYNSGFVPVAPTGTFDPVMQTVTASNRYFINGLGATGELQNVTTTCLGDNFYEHSGKIQDGYTYGDLRNVNVSPDGILTANYSNGVSLELYQITLHDFASTQNLRREGGNLFSETPASGNPSSGAAGTGTFGTTQGYSLEQSNVDLSREFVNMITTQRGFQANSKGITTVDTMLETVINMKR
ncbi:flagellar hook-basal body complex protein [Desulfovibrio sp. OttesenSCG-928-G15]|nr:flagellar hook-basal body complex protein [Desulfovibrio sp. OttesenSCG-928-G15]